MGKRLKIAIGILVITVIVAEAGFLIYEKRVERQKDAEILAWQTETENLVAQLDDLESQMDELTGKKEYLDDGFNYLAIGNSITVHKITNYWWSECGMAVSKPEKDFVHLVVDYLEKEHDKVCYYAVSFKVWELLENDRGETYSVIDPYLNKRLDLITVQLGENVYDTETFESDFEELISYIQEKAPDAQILVIDDFWMDEERAAMKKRVAKKMKVTFVSLDEIKEDEETYRCGKGTVVYGDDGEKHIVEHEGVAGHPNDKGMKYIAEAIIDVLDE